MSYILRRICELARWLRGTSGAHAAPAFADIDGDGLVDLVIGKATSGALTYHKNVGSSTTAEFQVERDGPFANVVVGRFSKPTFYDIDNDGDQDLIVGDSIGNVLLYLNVGSRFDPSFLLVEAQTAPSARTTARETGRLNSTRSRRRLMAKRWLAARPCASFRLSPFAEEQQMHQTFGALPLLDLWAARRRRGGKRARVVVSCSIIDHETHRHVPQGRL